MHCKMQGNLFVFPELDNGLGKFLFIPLLCLNIENTCGEKQILFKCQSHILS